MPCTRLPAAPVRRRPELPGLAAAAPHRLQRAALQTAAGQASAVHQDAQYPQPARPARHLPSAVDRLQPGPALGVVIGKDASRVSVENALAHVAGYTIVNEFSLPEDSYYRPAVKAKCRDGFCALGLNWCLPRKCPTPGPGDSPAGQRRTAPAQQHRQLRAQRGPVDC